MIINFHQSDAFTHTPLTGSHFICLTYSFICLSLSLSLHLRPTSSTLEIFQSIWIRPYSHWHILLILTSQWFVNEWLCPNNKPIFLQHYWFIAILTLWCFSFLCNILHLYVDACVRVCVYMIFSFLYYFIAVLDLSSIALVCVFEVEDGWESLMFSFSEKKIKSLCWGDNLSNVFFFLQNVFAQVSTNFMLLKLHVLVESTWYWKIHIFPFSNDFFLLFYFKFFFLVWQNNSLLFLINEQNEICSLFCEWISKSCSRKIRKSFDI